MSEARTLANAPMPARIARLPRDARGYPIPWFVATLDDGSRDFRIADGDKRSDAVRFDLCWLCGQPLGANLAFTIGPMCAVNRISAEPPGHYDCATYSARVCPFLATPQMVRREAGKPEGIVSLKDGPGLAIERNPGVALVWSTRRYDIMVLDRRDRSKFLCQLGDPTGVDFWCRGRRATRDEIVASLESGLPILEASCQLDDDPAASRAALAQQYETALLLVPA